MTPPSPRCIGQLWAETTDEVIRWASTLSRTELEDVLRYLRLSTEGDESALTWRLVRHHHKIRGMSVSWNSMVDEALHISSLRTGPSWVEDTASAPRRYVVSDTRRLTAHQATTEMPKQPLDGETGKGVTFALAPPQDEWSPETTSLKTPPLFSKPLGCSTNASRPTGTRGARRETVAERLTASARKGSEASARTAFDNTLRSSSRLTSFFAPGSEACTDDNQASTSTRASYSTADEEGDRNDLPSHESRPMVRYVSR